MWGRTDMVPVLSLCQWAVSSQVMSGLPPGRVTLEMTFSLTFLLLMFSGQLCMLTKFTNKHVHPINKKLFLMFWKLNIWALVLPVWIGNEARSSPLGPDNFSLWWAYWIWQLRFPEAFLHAHNVPFLCPSASFLSPDSSWYEVLYSTLQPGNLKHTHDLAEMTGQNSKNSYLQNTYCPTSKSKK